MATRIMEDGSAMADDGLEERARKGRRHVGHFHSIVVKHLSSIINGRGQIGALPSQLGAAAVEEEVVNRWRGTWRSCPGAIKERRDGASMTAIESECSKYLRGIARSAPSWHA